LNIIGNGKDLLADSTDISAARLNNQIIYYNTVFQVLNAGVVAQRKFKIVGPLGKRLLLRNISLSLSQVGFSLAGDGYLNLPLFLAKSSILTGGVNFPAKIDNSLVVKTNNDILDNCSGTLVTANMIMAYEKVLNIDTTGFQSIQPFTSNIFAEGNFLSIMPGVQIDMILDPFNNGLTGNLNISAFFTLQYFPI
jgi:hypothetical protein